jgi:hypothetical protein
MGASGSRAARDGDSCSADDGHTPRWRRRLGSARIAGRGIVFQLSGRIADLGRATGARRTAFVLTRLGSAATALRAARGPGISTGALMGQPSAVGPDHRSADVGIAGTLRRACAGVGSSRRASCPGSVRRSGRAGMGRAGRAATGVGRIRSGSAAAGAPGTAGTAGGPVFRAGVEPSSCPVVGCVSRGSRVFTRRSGPISRLGTSGRTGVAADRRTIVGGAGGAFVGHPENRGTRGPARSVLGSARRAGTGMGRQRRAGSAGR